MISVNGSFGLVLATISLLSTTATDPGRIEIPTTHGVKSDAATGLQHFEEKGLRGLFYVPRSYHPNEALPLLILLHGGGHHASDWFGSYSRRADKGRFIVVAPDSFGRTWGSTGDYGPDVARINGALAFVFSRYAIDPKPHHRRRFFRRRFLCALVGLVQRRSDPRGDCVFARLPQRPARSRSSIVLYLAWIAGHDVTDRGQPKLCRASAEGRLYGRLPRI